MTRRMAVWNVAVLGASRLLGEEKPGKLTTVELEKILQEEKNLLFLDAREPNEIQSLGSIEGYVNIPVGQLEARLSEVPKDRLIVTAGNRGARAVRAADILAGHGYKVIGFCGLAEWKQKGKPLVYPAQLVDVVRLWDGAPHNAFTDLIRYREQWYCTFREGAKHVAPDGSLRVLSSPDRRRWISAALLRSEVADLRDPKLSIAGDGRLMLTAAAALHPPAAARHQTMAWFSRDGRQWSEPAAIGEPDVWLWRVTWHKGTAYGVGYNTTGQGFVRMYASRDGRRFETLVERLFDRDFPNEAALLFLPDDSAVCLLRRDKGSMSAQLGTAAPPYREWKWKDLGVRIGGPQLVRLPDGRILAGTRLLDGKTRTALCRVDVDGGGLREILSLPSGGDTSYPGMAWHDGLLWMSYYSSHEGKTCVYLARVKV